MIHHHTPRLTAQELNNGHSSAFRSPTQPDPFQHIQDSEIMLSTSLPYTGHIQLTSQPQAYLDFYYQCLPTCTKLWFQLDSPNPESSINIPLQHPIFQNHRFIPVNQDQGFTIYQKTYRYANLQQIIQDPNPKYIVADKLLSTIYGNQIPVNAHLQDLDDTNADIIISTYQPSPTLKDWQSFTLEFQTLNLRQTDNTTQFTLYSDQPNIQIKLARWKGNPIIL